MKINLLRECYGDYSQIENMKELSVDDETEIINRTNDIIKSYLMIYKRIGAKYNILRGEITATDIHSLLNKPVAIFKVSDITFYISMKE